MYRGLDGRPVSLRPEMACVSAFSLVLVPEQGVVHPYYTKQVSIRISGFLVRPVSNDQERRVMSEKIALLEKRIRKLERRTRVVTLMAICAVAVGTAISMTGVANTARASSPSDAESGIIDNVRVRSLEVVDPNGITRVRLGRRSPMPNKRAKFLQGAAIRTIRFRVCFSMITPAEKEVGMPRMTRVTRAFS